jgi:hypothetical protein
VGSSIFVRLLPYLEQQVLARAYNTSLTNWVADNSTVGASGLSVLWCPSDGAISGLHVQYPGWGWDGSTQILTYTSYAGSMGNFCKVPINVTSPSQHLAVLNQADGLFFYLGWPGINPPVASSETMLRTDEFGGRPQGSPPRGRERKLRVA